MSAITLIYLVTNKTGCTGFDSHSYPCYSMYTVPFTELSKIISTLIITAIFHKIDETVMIVFYLVLPAIYYFMMSLT
jgi:hypothetical protein